MLRSKSALVAGRYHSGTLHRPVAFLPFDLLRLSHQNLSHEDHPATTIDETTLSSFVWSRPAASIHRIRIR